MKKIYFLVVTAFFSLFITACHYDGDTIVTEKPTPTFNVVIEELTAKELTVPGKKDAAGKDKTLTVGFRQGKEDIPYVSLDTDLLQYFLVQQDTGSRYTLSAINADTKQVTITNTERGNTKAVLDLTKHTLAFENYDLFFQIPSNVYMDPTACEAIKTMVGEDTYIQISDYSNIAGQQVALGWYTQDVGVVLWKKSDGSYSLALPLQMFNDVFLSPVQNFLEYNGDEKYLFCTELVTSNLDILTHYYNSPRKGKERSAAMAELCYNELCLNLDFNYGLKAIHGIDKFPDFDTYFASAGIKNDLKSTNAVTFANALKDVCEFYFGDGHSNYMYNSPYLEMTTKINGNHTSPQKVKYAAENEKYMYARNSDPKGEVPGYVLSQDEKTAIIRFDEFTFNGTRLKKADRIADGEKLINDNLLNKYVTYTDEKRTKHAYETTYDTVAFIYAVNKTIKDYDAAHPDAKIENIVLDMSCNGGGANHSACVVLAWMLGKCDFAFTNPITGAKWTISYKVDVNMDGTYGDAADTVKDKKLFCLISPCSFSCGNMVPAMLKASDSVTILGVTSSGGSSCVQNSSAADGTIFRMSSKNVMSINKNGSNYDIDRGVDPHYYINVPANFYDKETINTLVKKINSGALQQTANP